MLSVPRPLQERLGEAATESLVEILRPIESDQEERREVQKEQLLHVLEERFLRHVADSEKRTNAEIAAVRADLGKEIAAARADLGKEITEVRKEIAEVRKEITVQTRWILAVLGGAAVLIPILQRVMAALIP
ncbi:MAG: hypothetical protein OXJ62_06260 [Spirochaetaceae bacterium]|nr:hypothetical protein [Spirochaetaceae bacterium]